MTLQEERLRQQPRRIGLDYRLTANEITQYRDQGYLIIEDVLSDEDMAILDRWFDHFIEGRQKGMGRDLCDMSQSYDTAFEDYQLVNAMLPSVYRAKELNGSVYEKIALSIAKQLYGNDGVQKDYDQFLAKKPGKDQAMFEMHQDLGYWPKTKSTWTATFSLAMNDTDHENGCLQVVPGSNREKELRQHMPTALSSNSVQKLEDREASHSLSIEKKQGDQILFLPVKRGSMTIHDERIVHGSGGNISDHWRRTYVMAFRECETIKAERAVGFTHSHNDKLDWKSVLDDEAIHHEMDEN